MVGALRYKGQRPLEGVYEVWKRHWVLHLRECLNAHHCLRYLCNGALISIRLSIVRSRENSQSQRYVHVSLILEAFSMHLMSPNNHL
jgi:hypothetical protein